MSRRAGKADEPDLRVDVHTGARTYVVGSRQERPNLPPSGCPFCPGGLEAPDNYDVRWFPNRWPAMADDRCEVLLYAPEHDASLPGLGAARVRKVVDLWADRSAAHRSTTLRTRAAPRPGRQASCSGA